MLAREKASGEIFAVKILKKEVIVAKVVYLIVVNLTSQCSIMTLGF